MNTFLSSNFDGEPYQGGIDEDGDPEDLGEHGDRPGSPSHRDLWDTGALAYLSSPDGDELYSYEMPHTTSSHHTITTGVSGEAGDRAPGHQVKECARPRRRHLRHR